MSLKNRLSTVEVVPVISRKNYTISLPISKPTSDKPKLYARLKTHSRKHSMPKIQISDVL